MGFGAVMLAPAGSFEGLVVPLSHTQASTGSRDSHSHPQHLDIPETSSPHTTGPCKSLPAALLPLFHRTALKVSCNTRLHLDTTENNCPYLTRPEQDRNKKGPGYDRGRPDVI